MPRCTFPAAALSDRGLVKLRVTVDEKGMPKVVEALCETPVGDGYAAAARACFAKAKFAPAVDESGLPVPSAALYVLQFVR